MAADIRAGSEPGQNVVWSAAACGFDLRVLRRRARMLGLGRGRLGWLEEILLDAGADET